MNLWSTIILVLTIIWFLLCSLWWYPCRIKQACGEDRTELTQNNTGKEDERPIVFNWESVDPILNQPGFDQYSNRLFNNKTGDNILEIEGHYLEGEENPSDFENLGMARANALKAFFLDSLPEARIRTKSRRVQAPEDATEKPFEASQMFWIKADTFEDQQAAVASAGEEAPPEEEEKETVVELEDRILIYHLFNSTERTVDPKVDNYLDKLSQRVRQTGEQIRLTGHTDDKGSDDYNQKLGQQRADFIKQLLTEKGVPAEQITTLSKGESDPIEKNNTEEGQAKNRRTEVVLLRQ